MLHKIESGDKDSNSTPSLPPKLAKQDSLLSIKSKNEKLICETGPLTRQKSLNRQPSVTGYDQHPRSPLPFESFKRTLGLNRDSSIQIEQEKQATPLADFFKPKIDMSPQRLPSFMRNNSNLGQDGFQNDFFSMLGGSSTNLAAQSAMRRDTHPTFLTRSMTKEFQDEMGLISPNNILASGKSR